MMDGLIDGFFAAISVIGVGFLAGSGAVSGAMVVTWATGVLPINVVVNLFHGARHGDDDGSPDTTS